MRNELSILKIMKKEGCNWEQALLKNKERKTLSEFLHPADAEEE